MYYAPMECVFAGTTALVMTSFFMKNDLKGGQTRVVISTTSKTKPDCIDLDNAMAQETLSAVKKGAYRAERTISAVIVVETMPLVSTRLC